MPLSTGFAWLACWSSMEQSIAECLDHVASLITEEMHLVGLEVQGSLSGPELGHLDEIRSVLNQFDQTLKRRA